MHFSKEHVLKIVLKLDKKSEMIQLPNMRGNEGKNRVKETYRLFQVRPENKV